MNLAELQKEAHAIAKEKGWWDEERTFGDLIALVHSELSEALEAYREHGLKDWRSHTYSDGFVDEHPQGEKPEGVASEFADVVIRVADMAEWYQWNLDHVRPFAYGGLSFGERITECHQQLSLAYGEARFRVVHIKILLGGVYGMAAHYGIDLDAAIQAKLEYNRSRPYRHGGKTL